MVVLLKPLSRSESKTELLVKLFAFSSFYGGILINWVDLVFGPPRYGYHLWLTIMYFAPFITVLMLRGLEDWELTISYGLTSSLLNDCLYHAVGRWLFGFDFNLIEWYKCQLLPVCSIDGYFDFLFFKVKPYPYLMPLSIYARVIITYLLLYKWWRK
jgi:hypothetical protein